MRSDFRSYWSAEVASTFGSVFTTTAISVVAVRSFHASAGEVGVITAAGATPALALGLLSGVLADRLRRPRRALMACDALAAITVAAVGAGLVAGIATIWWLVALALVLGTVITVVEPVYFTHLSGLVPAGDLVRGRARLQTGEYGAAGIGKALAGPVIALCGGALALGIDAVTYIVSWSLLRSLRAPDQAAVPQDRPAAPGPQVMLHEAIEGVREVRRHPILFSLSGFIVAWSVIAGATTALTVPFLLRTLAVPTSLYGALFAVVGVAGLAGSAIGSRLIRRRSSVSSVAFIGFGTAAATSILLPAAGGPLALAMIVAVLGLSLPAVGGAIANIGLTGVLTEDVPGHVLGRVISVLKTAAMSAQIVGALGGGWLGDGIGVRGALWVLGAAAMASPLLLTPAIRSTMANSRTDSPVTPEIPVTPPIPVTPDIRVTAGVRA